MSLGRRRMLMLSGAAALLQACSAPAPPAVPTPVAPSNDWDKIVAAAKSEGAVTVNTFPGSANQTALAEFSKA
jgi:hypothetical protein